MNSVDQKPAKARKPGAPASRAAAAPSGAAPVQASAQPAPSSEAIARRAYQRWEQSGGAHGDDQRHWYEAERELHQ